MKILITGGNGYIGAELSASLSSVYEVVKISRIDVDLVNADLVKDFFSNHCFDVVIHSAFQGGSRFTEDKIDVLDNNLKMYYNLLSNKNKYKRFINIGSGADIYAMDKPYGLSKYVIRKSLEDKVDFYNLRVFGIFNQSELQTRFIKSNMLNYLNKSKMNVIDDKLMDFIFMDDFISIVKHFVINDDLPKNFDCVYSKKFRLSEILHLINNLDNHKVEIEHNNCEGKSYTGNFMDLKLNYIGLEDGLRIMYKEIGNKI